MTIKNRDAILALDGGWLIVQALEAREDDARASPMMLGSVSIRADDGDPNGRFDDPVGALYLRTNPPVGVPNTTLYVKEVRSAADPTKGWVAK